MSSKTFRPWGKAAQRLKPPEESRPLPARLKSCPDMIQKAVYAKLSTKRENCEH